MRPDVVVVPTPAFDVVPSQNPGRTMFEETRRANTSITRPERISPVTSLTVETIPGVTLDLRILEHGATSLFCRTGG